MSFLLIGQEQVSTKMIWIVKSRLLLSRFVSEANECFFVSEANEYSFLNKNIKTYPYFYLKE